MSDGDPEVSIVIPCLNEEPVIGEFVDWCMAGLKDAGTTGEVLIIDSSTDKSAQIAEAHGARVITVPKRGVGRAYIDATPHIRGKWVITGDCDLTYDFRQISPFIERLRAGDEFVMSNRFGGKIERGAMPPLHQYFGTPLTTFMFNVIYGTRLGDIHTGMRGLTTRAYKAIKIQSQSWEYATEMIIKAVQLKIKISEVIIPFYKDRPGRQSHHKRVGWRSPWYAGWITLQAMFTFGADFFLIKPGVLLLILGLLIVLPTSFGPVNVGPFDLSLHWMLAGMCAAVLGAQSIYLGMLARLFYDHTGVVAARYRRVFPYNRSVIFSAVLFLLGIVMTLPLIIDYIRFHFYLPEALPRYYLTVTGLFFMIAGFLNFAFTLLMHAFLAVKEYWH
jgi:glycosyltransferase involved in cell wall biosynthesis